MPPKIFLYIYYIILYFNFQSKILPSVEIVTTCQGMNFPLAISAAFAARSSPAQQGTSIRTIVTLFISLFFIIAVSFSV
jgi:hypothetical protein